MEEDNFSMTTTSIFMTSSTKGRDVNTRSADDVPSFWEYNDAGFPLPPWSFAVIAACGLPILVGLIWALLQAINKWKQASFEEKREEIIEEKIEKAKKEQADMMERCYTQWQYYEAEGTVPSIYTQNENLQGYVTDPECPGYDADVSQITMSMDFEDSGYVFHNGAYSWDEGQGQWDESLWTTGQWVDGQWMLDESYPMEGYYVDGFGFYWAYDWTDTGVSTDGDVVIEEVSELENGGGSTLKIRADVEPTTSAVKEDDIAPLEQSMALDVNANKQLYSLEKPFERTHGEYDNLLNNFSENNEVLTNFPRQSAYMNVEELVNSGLLIPVLPNQIIQSTFVNRDLHRCDTPTLHPPRETRQRLPDQMHLEPPPAEVPCCTATEVSKLTDHYGFQQSEMNFTNDDNDFDPPVPYPDDSSKFTDTKIPGGGKVSTMPRIRGSISRTVTFKDEPEFEVEQNSFVDLYTTTRRRNFVPTRPAPPPPRIEGDSTYSRSIPRTFLRQRPALDLSDRHSYLSVTDSSSDSDKDCERKQSLSSGYEVPLPSEPTSSDIPVNIGINPSSSTLMVRRGSTLSTRVYSTSSRDGLVAEVSEACIPEETFDKDEKPHVNNSDNVYDDIHDLALDRTLDDKFPVYENFNFVSTVNVMTDEGYSSAVPGQDTDLPNRALPPTPTAHAPSDHVTTHAQSSHVTSGELLSPAALEIPQEEVNPSSGVYSYEKFIPPSPQVECGLEQQAD